MRACFRQPYQQIYDGYCFRPGLAQNSTAEAIHSAFNARLRTLLREWIKQKHVPTREQLEARLSAEFEQIQQRFSTPTDDYASETICPDRLDGAFVSLQLIHHSYEQADTGKCWLVWTALISQLDLSYGDMEFLRRHFGGELDVENEVYRFTAGRALMGPRTRARGSRQALARFDEIIRRRARHVLHDCLVNETLRAAPGYRQSRLRRWWDAQRLTQLAR